MIKIIKDVKMVFKIILFFSIFIAYNALAYNIIKVFSIAIINANGLK